MKKSGRSAAHRNPAAEPGIPPVVPRFTDREYLNIVYRTDADALRAVVPEPLRDRRTAGAVRDHADGRRHGYGPYTESGQAIQVRYEGERGEYLHAMYLDNFPATASGREAGAYPEDHRLARPVRGPRRARRLPRLRHAAGGDRDDGLQAPRPGPRRGDGADHRADVHAQDGPRLRRRCRRWRSWYAPRSPTSW